jgi:hypothetical protein
MVAMNNQRKDLPDYMAFSTLPPPQYGFKETGYERHNNPS